MGKPEIAKSKWRYETERDQIRNCTFKNIGVTKNLPMRPKHEPPKPDIKKFLQLVKEFETMVAAKESSKSQLSGKPAGSGHGKTTSNHERDLVTEKAFETHESIQHAIHRMVSIEKGKTDKKTPSPAKHKDRSKNFTGEEWEVLKDYFNQAHTPHRLMEYNGVEDLLQQADGSFKCPCCPNKFAECSHVKSHYNSMHTEQGRRAAHCETCGKTMSNPFNLRVHILTRHTDPNTWEFQCRSGCWKKYPTLHTLNNHQKICSHIWSPSNPFRHKK